MVGIKAAWIKNRISLGLFFCLFFFVFLFLNKKALAESSIDEIFRGESSISENSIGEISRDKNPISENPISESSIGEISRDKNPISENPISESSIGEISRDKNPISENPISENSINESWETNSFQLSQPLKEESFINLQAQETSTHQDYLSQLSVFEAWKISTGLREVVVAIIDTGFNYKHKDLKDALWINEAERDGVSGVDDDDGGSGYVDDIHGWDFVGGDSGVEGTIDNWHGTHVASLVTNVFPKAKLMLLKAIKFKNNNKRVLFQNESAEAKLIEAIQYAINKGANVINVSWSLSGKNPSLKKVFQEAYDAGIFIVASAGNNSTNPEGVEPTNYESTLAVGSINSNYQLSSFSNYGDVVEVYASGGDEGSRQQGIYGAVPGEVDTCDYLSGTSMATPIVAGLAAYIMSFNDEWTPKEVSDIILSTSNHVNVNEQINSSGEISVVNFRRAIKKAFEQRKKCSDGESCESLKQIPQKQCRPSAPSEIDSFGGCGMVEGSNQNKQGPFLLLLFLLPLVTYFRQQKVFHF